MVNFDPVALAEETTAQFEARFQALGVSPEEFQENLGIMHSFNKIATEMLATSPGIESPGSAQPIPHDDKTIHQTLSLFSEGIYLALVKCLEMGITNQITGYGQVQNEQGVEESKEVQAKSYLLQQVAGDVFTQTNQIVASTYGQENTPDFQFSFEQQVEWINQAAEGSLLYHIAEWEQRNGPIEVAEVPSRLLPKVEQAMREDGVPIPHSAGSTAPVQSQAKGPTPHDKYGAVALLLTTLPADQRARILQNFNAEEKELISFYSHPQHIEQNLDTACVETHLKRFKEMLKQGGSTLKSSAWRGMARLAKSTPQEKLLSWVKDERPGIKRYIASHYGQAAGQLSFIEGSSPTAPRGRHLTELLPGRIEEILYKYLAKRLDPTA